MADDRMRKLHEFVVEVAGPELAAVIMETAATEVLARQELQARMVVDAAKRSGGPAAIVYQVVHERGMGRAVERGVDRLSSVCADETTLARVREVVSESFDAGRLRGIGQALRILAAQRFGPVPPLLELALDVADAHALQGVFDRFGTATTVEELLEPLLPKSSRR